MPTSTDAARSSSPQVDFGRLADLLGYQLRTAQVQAFETFPQIIGSSITPVQLAVLLLIEANPGIKQTSLATALNVDRSTMVRLVDRCEDASLVRRGSSSSDRRIAPPVLTARGRALIRSLLPKIAKHEARLSRTLTRLERQTLLHLLRKVNGYDE